MKSVTLIGLLLMAILRPLSAQTQTGYTRLVSERVGTTLNQQQRNYFMLFPEVKDFQKATFTVNTDSSVSVVLQHSNSTGMAETNVTLQAQAARDLAFYIDYFERIYLHQDAYRLDCDLSRIRHLLRPLQRYRFRPDADPASVRLLNGGYVDGEIIAATDSILVLWTAGTPYDWKKVSTLARMVHYSEINVLDDGKEVTVRGNKKVFDNFTAYARPDLAFYSKEDDNLPPELLPLLSEVRPVQAASVPKDEPALLPFTEENSGFIVRTYTAFPVSSQSNYIHRLFTKEAKARQNTTEENIPFNTPMRSNISTLKIAYPLSQQWRLGGLISYAGLQDVPTNTLNNLSMSGASVGIAIDRTITGYNPVSPTFWGNLESEISLSVQGHFYTVSTFSGGLYNSYERVAYTDLNNQHTQTLVSLNLGGTIGYRLWKVLNVFAGIEMAFFPSIQIEKYTQTYYRFGRSYEYGWQGGTATYMEGNVSIGASLFL